MGEYAPSDDDARRLGHAARRRRRPLQRARHHAPARRCASTSSSRLGGRRRPRRSTGCPAPSRSRWSPSASRSRASRRGDLPRRGRPGRDAALRVRGRRLRGRHRARSRSTPASRWSSACSRPTTRSRRSTAPAAARATRVPRRPRPRSRWSQLLRALHRLADSERWPDAEHRAARRARSSGRRSQLFEDADLGVQRALRRRLPRAPSTTRASTDVRILRPQEIPRYVAEGLFDLGITGRDWIEETGADVVTLAELHYSKATARPIRVVLAVAADSAVATVGDLPAGRPRAHRVPGAHAAVLRASTASTPTSSCRTAPPKPRSPTSPMRSSRSPRPAARCAPRG